jgi:hypothetical protein
MAFKTIQNRKPWNKVVAWLYSEAIAMAENSEALGIKTIAEFEAELKRRLDLHLAARADKGTAAKNIYIHSWWEQACGINRPMCADRAAFLIRLEK